MSEQTNQDVPLTPGRQANLERIKITLTPEWQRIVNQHQACNCIRSRTEAILSLMRIGAKAEGLLGGGRQ